MAEPERWLPTLVTPDAQSGYELAVKLSRMAVKLTQPDGEVREGIIDQLPVMLQMIASYWQEPGDRFARGEPVRSAKIGRNQLCLCGSGKKYNKCCGDHSRLQ